VVVDSWKLTNEEVGDPTGRRLLTAEADRHEKRHIKQTAKNMSWRDDATRQTVISEQVNQPDS